MVRERKRVEIFHTTHTTHTQKNAPHDKGGGVDAPERERLDGGVLGGEEHLFSKGGVFKRTNT
jgi:hypothetical protein